MSDVRHAVTKALGAGASQTTSIDSSVAACLRLGTACAVALSLLGLGTAATAQEQHQGHDAQAMTLEEITVTGSRIRRTTDFSTPNPTTVVDADFLDNLGIVNVGEAIAQLPANISNNTPTTTGNANFFAGSTIANLRGLNPFFGSRTLNLVNNRRFVPTNQGDGVDLNFIPKILIERMDVVTGGASAAYGSGAISGVTNIFLNRTLEGGRVEVDYGQTGESDGKDRHTGLAFGTRLFGDRAHLVVGYEWQDSDPVGCVNARDWCARSVGFIQNPDAATDPNAPDYLLRENVRANQISYTGVFHNSNPGATQTWQLNAAGTGVVPFNIGQGDSTSAFSTVVGGDGRSVHQYTNLRAPVEKDVATAVFTMDLTDAVRMSVDLSWGKVETLNRTGAVDTQFAWIAGDNAYVLQNPELQTVVGGGTFFNKDWTAQVDSYSLFSTEVKRAAIGFDGRIGDSSWTWDAYYQFGETDRLQYVNDNRHLNRFLMALDAVLDADGNVVCRVTRDGFAGAVANNPFGGYATANPALAEGCVPINAFGSGALPADAYDYAFGFLREDLKYRQQVVAANFSGDLWEGVGAGPFQAAFGLEFRREEGVNLAAEEVPLLERTDYLIQYGDSFAGDVDVTEAFLELNTPLLRGRPGASLLELNTAVRFSRYENQGGFGTTGLKRDHDMTTWKVSLVYDPVDWLRLRSTRSRDMRAANFRELYYGQKIQAGGVFGFCGPTGTFQTDPCNWSLEGNVELDPEKADTTTFGFVLTPRDWVPGLQFAVDYFHIEIEDAIQQASINRVLDGCRESQLQEFCDLIQWDGTTYDVDGRTYQGIDTVRALAFNGSGYKYEGIDFSGSYLWDLGDAGTLNFRLIATKMLQQKFQPTPGQPFVDIVGQTGTSNSFLSDNQPTADWVANLTATYLRGPFSLTGQLRYVDDGIMDYLGLTPDDPGYPNVPVGGSTMDVNRVPSYAVFGLSGSYRFENIGFLESLQIWAAVDNVFDKDPPIASGVGFGGGNGGTNPVFFDTMGRAFRLGIRTSF